MSAPPAADRPAGTLRLALRWVRLLVPLVPAPIRRRWRQEWQGELWHAATHRRLTLGRTFSALPHALTLRRQELDSDMLVQDFRYALRQVRRNGGFSLVVVTTLALGIGANALVFSVLDSTVLNPLAFKDADRLVYLWRQHPTNHDWMMSPQMDQVRAWRESVDLLESVQISRFAMLSLTGEGDPVRLHGARVGPGFFDFLGVQPLLGRSFEVSEAIAGNDRVTVLGHGLWQERFGGSPEVLGRDLLLDDEPHTVIGVLPRSYRPQTPLAGARLYTPLVESESNDGVTVMARLREGGTLDALNAELAAVAEAVDDGPEAWRGIARSPRDMQNRSYRTALWAFQGAVALVLLIAITNVANLTLVRSSGQRREIAIRGAIGGTRGRLVRQLLVESLLLAVAGGVMGLLGAALAVQAIDAARPDELRYLETLRLDPRVVGATALVTIVAGLGIGLLPAFQATRRDPGTELAENPRTASGGKRRLRSSLVVVEVALSAVLLVGASLLVQTFLRVQALDPGFEAHGALTMRISLPPGGYPESEERLAFWNRLDEALRSALHERVTDLALTSSVPPDTGVEFGAVQVEGAPPIADPDSPITAAGWVSPDYFGAMHIPLRSGRTFAATPVDGADVAAIISESFARAYWPGGDPLGQRFRFDDADAWRRVVGVVGDVRPYGLTVERGDRHVYYSLASRMMGDRVSNSYMLVLRAAGEPQPLVDAVKQVVWSIDPRAPITELAPLSERLGETVALPRFNAQLMSAFAALALCLSLVGVYSVLSYAVIHRQHEMGVRMALGASGRRVMRLVAREGLILIGGGVALGCLAAALLTGLIQGLLYGMQGPGGTTYLVAVGALVGVGLLATLVPARRATRVDPMMALRTD